MTTTRAPHLLPLAICPICGQQELTILRPRDTIAWGRRVTEHQPVLVEHTRPLRGVAGYLRRLWPWSPDPICQGSGREAR